jgi:hypothetical protein
MTPEQLEAAMRAFHSSSSQIKQEPVRPAPHDKKRQRGEACDQSTQ